MADELSCGIAPGNHLVLTDPAVSRHHFVLAVTPRGAHVRDTGSTNGVFLDGHCLESAWIQPGPKLQVGHTTLRFEDGEGPRGPAAAGRARGVRRHAVVPRGEGARARPLGARRPRRAAAPPATTCRARRGARMDRTHLRELGRRYHLLPSSGDEA